MPQPTSPTLTAWPALVLAWWPAHAEIGPDLQTRPPSSPTLPSSAKVRPAPGVEIDYQLLSPSPQRPGPARLGGLLEAGGGQLRTAMRIDPEGRRAIERLETRWETSAPGMLKTLVIGDTHGSGGGWSRPVRIGGLRFGRPVALRNTPDGASPAGPAAAVPARLDAGATDYEVALGRLRSGWDTANEPYRDAYAAAGWRTGLGAGLSMEARGEWTPTRTAQGLEVVQHLGAEASLQAVLARSETEEHSGVRWGMQFAGKMQSAAWKFDVRGADAAYTPVTGGPEARAAIGAGAQLPLGRRTVADLTYTRTLARDAQVADGTLKLSARTSLSQRVQMSVGLSLDEGPQARWGAALSLTVPLEPQAP